MINSSEVNTTQTTAIQASNASPLAQLRANGFKVESGLSTSIKLDDGTVLNVSCGESSPRIFISAASTKTSAQISAELSTRFAYDLWQHQCKGGTDGATLSYDHDEHLNNAIEHVKCLQMVLTLCKELMAETKELSIYRDYVSKARAENDMPLGKTDPLALEEIKEDFSRRNVPVSREQIETVLSGMEGTVSSFRNFYKMPISNKDVEKRIVQIYTIEFDIDAIGKKEWIFNGEKMSTLGCMERTDVVDALAKLELYIAR